MSEADLWAEIRSLKNQLDRMKTQQTPGIWKSFTPTPTGYSSTTQAVGKYFIVGKICTVYLRIDGTSNSTSFSALLPNTIGNQGFTLYQSSALALDNTAQVTTASTFILVSGGTSVLFGKGVTTSTTSWTASGRKLITGLFSYEIA